MLNRAPPFEAIENFRDYGGYTVAGGRRLRPARLYRSAHHGHAKSQDLYLLEQLGITSIVDLRGPSERANAPSRRPSGFSARLYESEIENGRVPPHLEAAVKGISTAEEARTFTEAVYADMTRRSAVVGALRLYFTALAETEGPSLIHCSAGKDRTGLAVALLHTAMGVHADDIMDDYLLTNTLNGNPARMAARVEKMRKSFGAHLSEDAAWALASVDQRYLNAAFAAIKERPGGMQTYLRDELGAGPEWRARAEAQLLA